MFGLRYGIEGWYFIVLLVIHLVVDRTEGIEGIEGIEGTVGKDSIVERIEGIEGLELGLSNIR